MRCKAFKKAMLVYMVILCVALVGIGSVLSPVAIAKEDKEIGPNVVEGKVLSIQTHPFGRPGIIQVKSDQTEQDYTFLIGINTNYIPRRYPTVGETVKVSYINDRGQLKATLVEIIQSTK
jgi:hypothetical protein